eukprot:8944696-Pyramimonas_sp.AAC.1
METFEDIMYTYPGIIKAPVIAKRGNGSVWTSTATSSSATLGRQAPCRCLPRRLRRRRDRLRRARAR